MTLNDRFDAAADAESAPDEQILAVREGDELLSHFQPPGRGTTATKDTLVVSRNNAGFGDGTGSDDNGDRRLDDAAPSKVLLGEQRDQYVKVKEEESIPGSGSAHALADDSEGRSEEGGGSSGKGRDDAMSYSPNQEDEHNRSRPRRAETAATTHHGEVAHPTSGQDLPSSPSSEANGGGDGNGSFSATETRIELESDMLAVADEERSGSAEVGGIGNTRPRQRSRHGNEGGTPADTTHASSSADTPHLPPSRSQVFATTPTVARNGEDSLKDGSVDPALAISLKKDVESSTSDDATTSTLTPPSSPACHAAGNTEGVDCGGGRAPEVTPGGNEAEGMNDAIDDAGAPTPFVFSAVPARFGRPESIAVGVEDDFVGTGDKKGRKGRNGGGRRRGGGSASESSVGTDSAFNFADGGLELGGSTASGEPGNSPDVDRVLDAGCSNHGGGGGGGDGRMGGCDPLSLTQNFMVSPASPYSQALHMILACAVFVLVAVHKAGDGGVPSRSNVSIGGSFASGAGTESSGSSSKRRPPGTRGATFRTDSTRRSSNEGTKRRKSGSGAGFPASRPPLLRRLRAAWSKLWHAAEKELATHWRAAGQALASLRQAWGALWVPPPHAEADVLAEALASPPRFRCRAVHGHGSVTVGVGASSDRRRRRRRRGSRNAGHQDVGTGGKSAGAGSSAQDAYVRGESATEPRRKLGLHFLNLWGFRPLMDPSGGRGSRSRSPKFLLVLDLDETLVHCSPYPLDPATRRPRSDGSVRHVRPDLKVEMRGGAPSDRPACMYAWKRPHLDVFLGIVSRWYEIAVFTSGRRCYAEPLLDLIDSRLVIGKRFYRDSCTVRDGGARSSDSRDSSGSAGGAESSRSSAPVTPQNRITSAGGSGGRRGSSSGEGVGYLGARSFPPATSVTPTLSSGGGSDVKSVLGSEIVKDLSVMDSEHFPLRTVHVDNQPRSVLQQANVLPIRSWFPKDTEDKQLLDLLPVLLALTSCRDVRSVLGLRPGLVGGGTDGKMVEGVALSAAGGGDS